MFALLFFRPTSSDLLRPKVCALKYVRDQKSTDRAPPPQSKGESEAQRILCRVLVLSCVVIGYVSSGFGQAGDPKSAAVVDQIMATALARCYSTDTDGFKGITFQPVTNQEVAEVKALGEKAVAPLARYLDLQPNSRSFLPLGFLWTSAALPR
jgi:hypothetical protein